MLIRDIRLENEIEKRRSGRRKRTALMIAVIAVLAGCQSFPDFGPGFGREPGSTSTSGNEAGVEKARSVYGVTEENDEIVTLDRPLVRRLQGQLTELGFPSGPIDGIVGPRTAGAIKGYQSAHNLPATGEISSRFLKHLDVTSASREANARPTIELGSGDFPTYQPGTTFVYSNGEVDLVSGAEGGDMKWIRSDGTSYTAHRNFLLPWSNWASDKQRGTATISEEADALWPLHEGAEVAFSANVTVQRRDDPNSTERRVDRWRCRNDGRQDLTVRAGKFETLVFVCGRGANPASPEVVWTWYYATNVRHYVRVVESDPKRETTRTVDLVAVRPGAPNWPPIVRAALGRAVVHALETPEKESKMLWTSSGVNTRVTIEAKSRFIAPNGSQCRRFKQTWSENGRHRNFHASACKTEAGRWQIPGLESSTEEALVTSGEIS